MFFFSLLIPIFLLPLLITLKLIRLKTVLTLWISFVVSAFCESLTENSIASIFAFIFTYLAVAIVFRSGRGRKKCIPMIVLGIDKENGLIFLWNEEKTFPVAFENCENISVGDVLTVNNCKILPNTFDNE